MSDECTAYSEGFSYSAHIHSSEVCFVTLAAFSQLSPPDVRTVWVRCWVSLSIAGVTLFQRRVRVAESEGAHISSLQTIWALVWHYWIKRKLIMSQVKSSVCVLPLQSVFLTRSSLPVTQRLGGWCVWSRVSFVASYLEQDYTASEIPHGILFLCSFSPSTSLLFYSFQLRLLNLEG